MEWMKTSETCSFFARTNAPARARWGHRWWCPTRASSRSGPVCARVRACVCVCARARACVRASARLCVCARARASVHASVRACVCVCARLSGRAFWFVHTGVRARAGRSRDNKKIRAGEAIEDLQLISGRGNVFARIRLPRGGLSQDNEKKTCR